LENDRLRRESNAVIANNVGLQQKKIAMATLTIRNVDAGVKERLRVRAARHGRSMEAEARSVLSEAVAGDRDQPELNLAEAIRRRLRRLAESISSCRRLSLSTHRPRSIRDRRRHQRHLGPDARGAASSSTGLGGRANLVRRSKRRISIRSKSSTAQYRRFQARHGMALPACA
jgi:plasmid stability protein